MVAELIRGALHLHPRPAPPHAIAGSSLGGEHRRPVPARAAAAPAAGGSSTSRSSTSARTCSCPISPDGGASACPRHPRRPISSFAPDWTCEILSPGTRRTDLTEKRDIYGAHGVRHLWYVDPAARTLEAFELRSGAWTLIAALKDADEVRVPPFDAVAFPLSALWPD